MKRKFLIINESKRLSQNFIKSLIKWKFTLRLRIYEKKNKLQMIIKVIYSQVIINKEFYKNKKLYIKKVQS